MLSPPGGLHDRSCALRKAVRPQVYWRQRNHGNKGDAMTIQQPGEIRVGSRGKPENDRRPAGDQRLDHLQSRHGADATVAKNRRPPPAFRLEV